MKILLADDDCDLIDLVSYSLVRHGHQVMTAADGVQALNRVINDRPEMVLVDASLPQMDGFDLCRSIREISNVPVILMSSRGAEADLIRGYESGADDYIITPFSPQQLLLRIQAVARRTHAEPRNGGNGGAARATVSDLVINPSSFEVSKGGVPIALTRLEFRILHCLATNAGAVIGSQKLAEYAWQSANGGDTALLKTHISHIRNKLALGGGTPFTIRSVSRTGYVLSPAAASDGESGDGDLNDENTVERSNVRSA
jgi:DNA-binding response OmpR family regulator